MQYAIVSRDRIRVDDRTFDFYRPDLFGERNEAQSSPRVAKIVPEDPTTAHVILREIPDTNEYQIIFGYLVVDKLPRGAELAATIYSAAELPDEECGLVILKHDRTIGAQVLTFYERACVIRALGVTMYRASKILGVTEPTIKNWLRGAEICDELIAAREFNTDRLSFSHLVALNALCERHEEEIGSEVSIEQKVEYLKKCSFDDLSVRQFRKWLEEVLGLVEHEAPLEDDKEDDEHESEHETDEGDDEESPSSRSISEVQRTINQLILEADLSVEDVRVNHGLDGKLNISATSVSVEELPRLADCLRRIHGMLRTKAAA